MTQPVTPGAGQPAAQQTPVQAIGKLTQREVEDLQKACNQRHKEKGYPANTLFAIAALVAGVWAGVVMGGFAGVLLAVATIILGVAVLRSIHDAVRNRDYVDAGEALANTSFKRYVQDNDLDIFVDNIVAVHKKYKTDMAEQSRIKLQEAHI